MKLLLIRYGQPKAEAISQRQPTSPCHQKNEWKPDSQRHQSFSFFFLGGRKGWSVENKKKNQTITAKVTEVKNPWLEGMVCSFLIPPPSFGILFIFSMKNMDSPAPPKESFASEQATSLVFPIQKWTDPACLGFLSPTLTFLSHTSFFFFFWKKREDVWGKREVGQKKIRQAHFPFFGLIFSLLLFLFQKTNEKKGKR